ncbi:MAG: hypothetical protein EPN31_15710 [Castellaniella sp.]|uniref:hypothetical protein n=1 Tax=Castellaniella sp. TaxID=1955812 RepID=UPI00121BC2D1|nr:hypothetical protein [Castellaniella sp.]TAN25188.1 MAG: hypothetical protein EPN31_15710 [Castellaniella sp.]
MKKIAQLLLASAAMVALLPIASAADRDLECSLKFNSKQWSALYSSAVGEGIVTCKDGSSMPVAIRAKGIGITAGKWKITDGKGTFTHVARIEDVLGSYLAVSGDVGVAKAGTAQALTKGKVSLVLAGKGKGFDVGVAISSFRISQPGMKAGKPGAAAPRPADEVK